MTEPDDDDPWALAYLKPVAPRVDWTAWDTYRVARTARFCRRVPMSALSRSAPELIPWSPACRVWSCRECSLLKVRTHLDHMFRVLGTRATAFIGTADLVDPAAERNRLKVAAKRGAHDPDRPGCGVAKVESVSVWRADLSKLFVLGTSDLSGRGDRMRFHFVDVQEALDFFADALSLPGVDRAPSYSRGWARPSPAGSPQFAFVSRYRDGDHQLDALRLASATLSASFGVPVDLATHSWPAPIPHAAVHEAIQEAIDATK